MPGGPQNTRKRLSQPGFDLAKFLALKTKQVNAALDRFLPSATTKPATIHRAMRYSLFAGGKRMRPALCLAAAVACDGDEADALPLACAVECIHTYSLVHDDLPAMDNDDYRRGKLTNHKVFGDGIAVLAGDALLTQAFELAAKCRGWRRHSHQQIILELAHAAGSLQLIAGQVADLERVRAHRAARGLLLDELRQRAIRHAVTNFDRHECLPPPGWFERGGRLARFSGRRLGYHSGPGDARPGAELM